MEILCDRVSALELTNTRNELSLEDILNEYNLQELITVQRIDAQLEGLSYVTIESMDDFKQIPKGKGGVYFIVTNEPIDHSFHYHKMPQRLTDGYEIIYNGTAQDLQDRAKKHLFRSVSKGMSGISIDLLTTGEKVESHTKCCYDANKRAKTPFVNGTRIASTEQLESMNFSEHEKEYIRNHQGQTLYFKNGINALDEKHNKYSYRFYYQIILSHSVRDIVETTWRKKNGVPRLCTYTEGR